MKNFKIFRFSIIVFCFLFSIILNSQTPRWTKEKAWKWYNQQPWNVGANFNPSTSINQLEFWQKETFDITTIERELEWSSKLGMNLHRVYLHNLLWTQDPEGFIKRIKIYLSIADEKNIKTMFVLLDDVWHPMPKLGKQPEPIPRVHNSGWVQSPGAEILGDLDRHDELESYIKGVISNFANDERVLVWDLYNEPDNVTSHPTRKKFEVVNKKKYSLELLKKVFKWAREINPSQPLTAGIWKGKIENWGNLEKLPELDRFMLANSDVISFHAYDKEVDQVIQKIKAIKKHERPLLCTEYLARGIGNSFELLLPIFKKEKIAAINWGLVSGKTNTIYPWSSWIKKFTDEPKLWHHDIFRSNGEPFSDLEINFIKNIISK